MMYVFCFVNELQILNSGNNDNGLFEQFLIYEPCFLICSVAVIYYSFRYSLSEIVVGVLSPSSRTRYKEQH